MSWDGMKLIELVHVKLQWQAFVMTVWTVEIIKAGEFLNRQNVRWSRKTQYPGVISWFSDDFLTEWIA